MKNDHNLDDLIIDDIKPPRNKGKSILTIVALLIIVLIVAIVMTRMFISENDQNAVDINKSEEVMISPDLKLDTSEQNAEEDKKELDKLSSMMEESLTDIDEESKKEIAPAAAESKSSTTKTEAAQSKPSADEIKPETTEVVEKAESTETEAPEAKPTEPESVPVVAAPKPAPKTVKAPAPKPKPKPVAPAKKSSSSSVYYIQVGSFSKQPSKQFLSVITRSGFHYQLKGGKLLVGPYKSDAAARRDLPRVKSKINKSAFIKHF